MPLPSFARPLVVAGVLLGFQIPVHAAGNYEFVPVPQIDLNRVYRLDKTTGEVSACQYGLRANGAPMGETFCYPPGQGAGPQTPSDYSLVATHHEKEAGIFRVDLRAGTIAMCYVLNDAVVCTAPAK